MSQLPRTVYSRDSLLRLNNNVKLSRHTRKICFSLKLWCPKRFRLARLKPNSKRPQTSDGVKCGLLNPRSINEKEAQICLLIQEYDLDILALTETWCHDKSAVSLKAVSPRGFSIIQVPRGSRGGGVGLIHRDSYSAKPDKCKKFDNFEHQTVHLKFGKESLRVR